MTSYGHSFNFNNKQSSTYHDLKHYPEHMYLTSAFLSFPINPTSVFYSCQCHCQTVDKITEPNDLEFLPEFHISSQHQVTSYDKLYGFYDLVPCQHWEFDEIRVELLNFIGLFRLKHL